MQWYQLVIRILFAVIFIAGGIAHFILGRLQPEGYAVFADTALFPWLSELWASFVMPNIGWLTIVLGVFEIGCGIGVLWKRTVTIATLGMIAFLVFITIVGYGFPAAILGEDLLKNRLITILMTGLLLPLLITRREPSPDSRS
ncbi:MAG: hypothetical protein ACTHW1_03345 [Ancrocorticia sp.]|uniref:hypothetical protein n=1 Tax=Ancrocorticia sp. TaxID=2593684 RepID=UPI003F9346F0